MVNQVAEFPIKSIAPILCLVLMSGCCFDEIGVGDASAEGVAHEAIVKAYHGIWHSFYDAENLSRMLVVAAAPGEHLYFDWDGEKYSAQETVCLRVNEQAYSEWETNAYKSLTNLGAEAYVVDEVEKGCRIIGSRIFRFPPAVEEQLVLFDKSVDEGWQERFVVVATLLDEDVPMRTVTLPYFKFTPPNGGRYSLPFHHLSRTRDVLALMGSRRKNDHDDNVLDAFAKIFYGDLGTEDDRFPYYTTRFEVKKEYDPCSYVAVGKSAGRVAANIISNMIPVAGSDCLACKYEVCQEEWMTLMGYNPSSNKGAKNPVENVKWFDCRLFVDVLNSLPEARTAKLRFMLPTLEEWLLACYGSLDPEKMYYASSENLEANGWFEFNSDGRSHEVGLKKPNALGLYDMMGNVSEFTCDAEDAAVKLIEGGSYEDGFNWVGKYPNGVSDFRSPEAFADVGFRVFAVAVQ